ncbi:15-hydroxyprostaglandin dehydrogenase [NAD(+)]-like [Phlebotomus argentipes]|uniref:15-hydroxyprostaglandin dehydrogenase [NAD(+)]-like n=1 Tax=Phlebotomus argentipes TaxID=94469 RepID=UPI00289363D3|nr:15-hydroxyprostaglandin dehydrogenase [NAD(+)]-like [Phlebotomus argentipes]
MEISGKSALITGGANGIGLAIAGQFLTCGGRKLALVDVQEPQSDLLASWRSQYPDCAVEFLPGDVTDEQSLRRIFRRVSEQFQGIDIVVNSAGIFDECDFERMFRVNVCGVINSSLLAIELMRQDRGGRGGSVLNISSIAALNPVLAAPLYSATKQAVLTITSSFADDFFFSRFGIHFHTLCPGATNTRLFVESFDARCLFPEFATLYHAAMAKYAVQDVQCVAQAALEALRDHRNGSVTVIDDGQVKCSQ